MNKNKKILFIIIVLALNCSANNWDRMGNIITGSTAGSLNGFSTAISFDGSVIATGEPEWNSNKGRVRIFQLVGNTWTAKGNPIEGENAGDQAGYSVTLSSDGNTVAFGEPGFNSNTGRVRVFKLNTNNTWTVVANANTAMIGQNTGDFAGGSIKISSDGTRIIFGEPFYQGSIGVNAGRVRIFQLSHTGGWTAMGSPIEGVSAGDLAGFSVAINSTSNNFAIIFGEPGHNSLTGRVRIYKFSSNNWTEIGSITGISAGAQAGYSVAMDNLGKNIAFGAPFYDSSKGYVAVYTQKGTSWSLLGDIFDMSGPVSSKAGTAIAMNPGANIIVVGAPDDNSLKGRVRIYQLINNKSWQLLGNSDALIGNTASEAGASVAINGNGKYVSFGAPFANSSEGIVMAFLYKEQSNLFYDGLDAFELVGGINDHPFAGKTDNYNYTSPDYKFDVNKICSGNLKKLRPIVARMVCGDKSGAIGGGIIDVDGGIRA